MHHQMSDRCHLHVVAAHNLTLKTDHVQSASLLNLCAQKSQGKGLLQSSSYPGLRVSVCYTAKVICNFDILFVI